MHIGERIVKLRKDNNMTQRELAEKMNIDPVIMNRIEKGSRALRDYELAKIARIFGCTTDSLLGHPAPRTDIENNVVGSPVSKIPIYGRIVAGYPSEAVQDILGYVHIPKQTHPEEFFALRVFGSSMEPTILDGDVVIVHRQPCVDSGKIAVLLINNEDATVKRVFVDDRGIAVRADNPAVFQPMYFSEREVQTLPVIILGAVVAMHRDF